MSLKRMVLAATLLLGTSGLALAQSTSSPAANNAQNPPTVSPSSPAAHDPGINPSAAGTNMGSRASGTSSNPNESARSSDSGLEHGANSFTEGQARRRIEDHGYRNVGKLHKDKNSIWQAEAMKNGQRVRVGVDFRGNVVEEK
jgi:hypothetical protein